MKRFSPYTAYKVNGEMQYMSVTPDGEKQASAVWHADRIKEIRSIFLRKNKNNQYRFKRNQLKIIRSILSGNDTFAVLPTGSGKSLSFQAPSVFFPGLTLVVTPLVALIENQVETFNGRAYPIYHPRAKNYYENIRFKAIYPGMDGMSVREMFAEIREPKKDGKAKREVQYKFLYVSPERLCNPKFLRALEVAERDWLRIDHVVIDEVHCMSQWGFEFRESYLHIAAFIRNRPVRPIISAFTATATPKDIAEVKNILGFPTDRKEFAKKKYKEFIYIEKRENLSLRILPCSDEEDALPTRLKTLTDILEKNSARVCIIYRTTAVGVDELYQDLEKNAVLKERLARYHAQMPERVKTANKALFLGSVDESLKPEARAEAKVCKNIMIATKAFGMGIDKGDISMIIHYDVPRSLEDYYQEVGRAGRDVEKVPSADCYFLYSVGPKEERGTLQYTIRWVTSEKEAPSSGCMPISSQFSGEMRESIYFWSYYRLCYVMKYCNIAKKDPEAAHDFIIAYLKSEFSAKQVAADLDYVYGYIAQHYMLSEGAKERFMEECLFRGADAARFFEVYDGQQANPYHAEIKRLMGEVNELHINNTYAANLLRYHPEKYDLGKPFALSWESDGSGQEWKSKKNKKVKGEVSKTLRRADIDEDAAFLFVSALEGCEEYANKAWEARRKKKREASVLFTVDAQCIINGVLKMSGGRWELLTGKEELLPYSRYVGADIRGLFPKERYGWWRSTGKGGHVRDTELHTDKLFVYAAGAREHEMVFSIYGGEKLDFFDMCVMDAVYSIEITQKRTVYVQTIWEVLTGRNPKYSSREKLDFRERIQKSIDKMRAMTISISDSQCGFCAVDEVLLPLDDKPEGQKGYSYSAIPPLFRYAEEMNGQIIKVPVSLLDVARIEKSALWRSDFSAEFPCGQEDKRFGERVKSLPWNGKWLGELLSQKDCNRLERLRKRACTFSPSAEDTLLCCYLLHRTAISRNRKRGNYIRFSTIKRVTGVCEDAALSQKKAAAVMEHYKRCGWIRQYYFYITDYKYRLADGGEVTDSAYFRVKPVSSAKCWRIRDTACVRLSDFTVAWSWRHNASLADDNSNFEIRTGLLDALTQEDRSLSPEEKRKLAVTPLGSMDGIVLQHK